mmetsp:Transcript_70163/g.222456  ORF Transcript_70163/g.222456 Transcript_70163/m.222456 type:complete len:559 (-) Transcript_70163:67-1743(-)
MGAFAQARMPAAMPRAGRGAALRPLRPGSALAAFTRVPAPISGPRLLVGRRASISVASLGVKRESGARDADSTGLVDSTGAPLTSGDARPAVVDWKPDSPLAYRPSTGPMALEVVGGKTLEGHVHISGAKNSALAIMAGTLVCSGTMMLRGVPALKDVRRMSEVLESVGCTVTGGADGSDTLLIDASQVNTGEPNAESVTSLRASFFIIGSLLARFGEAILPLPGGCNIGTRPVEEHIKGLKAMGATITFGGSGGAVVHAVAPAGGLYGAKIYMDCPSVGATETLLMAASLAEGETVISNAAQEPEVMDLADFLNSMGAKIVGAGTGTITIEGVKKLGSTDFKVIPDRIEAGTFLCAAAITDSSITMSPVVPSHIASVIAKLNSTGCRCVMEGKDVMRIHPAEHPNPCRIETRPFPGFPTDMQAQFMALLTRSEGTSIVTETVFENRLQHVAELQRMGARIRMTGPSSAAVDGAKDGRAVAGTMIEGGGVAAPLWGTTVQATDLRAGAALVIAGMAAQGVTHVKGLNHIDRGYEMFDEKLRGLGADVRRVPLKTEDLD